MKKRILSLLLVLAMAATALAGCSEPASQEETTSTQSQAEEQAQQEEENTGYNGVDNLVVSEDPMTLSLFYVFGGNGAPTGDMPIWQEAANITGVSMENVASESITDEVQAINTMLASGDLPDLIHGWNTNITPLISQGAFIPLDDLIEEHAPNIKKFLEDYPDARSLATGSDGQKYLITGTYGGEAGKSLPSMGLFIRQDWLDTLELPVPTTIEELEETFIAFRNDDPNGNGVKDEIPYLYRDKGIRGLLQFFGSHSWWYLDEETGEVEYGKAEEEYKYALTELARWYELGLIDPEIFTRGAQARQELLGTDVGGSTIDWFQSTGSMNDTVKEQVPDINFVAIPPVADVNGDVGFEFSRSSIHGYVWGISKDCEDPVAAIKYMDFFFSEEGSLLINYGLEGEHYTMVDGEPIPTEETLNHSAGYPNFMRSIGSYEIGKVGTIEGELATMNEQAKAGFEMYEQSDWLDIPLPALTFTEEEEKAISDNWVNIETEILAFEQSCLLGAQTVEDTWDDYIALLESMEFSAIEEAYNAAYQRYLESTQ